MISILFPNRYWNNPDVLGKLGKAMGGSFDLPNVNEDGEDKEAEGEEEEEEEAETILAAASAGTRVCLCGFLSAFA